MKIDQSKIGLNFWEVHPQIKFLGEFKKLYDSDKSKKKEKSSAIMWAIFLVYDPDSELFNFELKEKIKLVSRDFLDFPFKEEDYKNVIDAYISTKLTPARRQLYVWNRKLDEKTAYLETLTYEDNADQIEKLLSTNDKLFKDYESILKRIEQESSGKVQGDAEESLREKGQA